MDTYYSFKEKTQNIAKEQNKNGIKSHNKKVLQEITGVEPPHEPDALITHDELLDMAVYYIEHQPDFEELKERLKISPRKDNNCNGDIGEELFTNNTRTNTLIDTGALHAKVRTIRLNKKTKEVNAGLKIADIEESDFLDDKDLIIPPAVENMLLVNLTYDLRFDSVCLLTKQLFFEPNRKLIEKEWKELCRILRDNHPIVKQFGKKQNNKHFLTELGLLRINIRRNKNEIKYYVSISEKFLKIIVGSNINNVINEVKQHIYLDNIIRIVDPKEYGGKGSLDQQLEVAKSMLENNTVEIIDNQPTETNVEIIDNQPIENVDGNLEGFLKKSIIDVYHLVNSLKKQLDLSKSENVANLSRLAQLQHEITILKNTQQNNGKYEILKTRYDELWEKSMNLELEVEALKNGNTKQIQQKENEPSNSSVSGYIAKNLDKKHNVVGELNTNVLKKHISDENAIDVLYKSDDEN